MDPLTLLQLAIRSLGITGLGIKVEPERGVIVASYIQAGQTQTKEITFAALESMFTQGPVQARTSPSHDFSTPDGR